VEEHQPQAAADDAQSALFSQTAGLQVSQSDLKRSWGAVCCSVERYNALVTEGLEDTHEAISGAALQVLRQLEALSGENLKLSLTPLRPLILMSSIGIMRCCEFANSDSGRAWHKDEEDVRHGGLSAYSWL
jgi:hypothetical protein